eukprot:CAMPEP_0197310068 /NCGR_PEP_ID=MMETSP0891-20130614/8694_1 /TAXON_ID=44058 ORGANISM="Aureoumbra lagunensis, Strain CCMP1510" /NCGR_SAMPLE_ID=MMETSP0891 /ASSEMBLY_ACC=CAM_ASM_000534 /LENGTH=554 /DNA_ID=CAMNT_0042795539 /DNA_START=14 /DNA_END=1678 /DNA_ORIENTATION=+
MTSFVDEEEEKIDDPQALKLIDCGDASDNYAFRLLEKNFDLVLAKVPKDAKVAVVSVVGAFRTGKSFLLTLMLRYLRYKTQFEDGGKSSHDWLRYLGDKIYEGNVNSGMEENEQSFQWRGGRQRMTTGISIWSEPFMLAPDLAVLILDTQGLFDNETTMGLTSCIFGLSTLMSSYQIYNVANRIQEDNLQQLALFTEYGRMAVDAQMLQAKEDEEITKSNTDETDEQIKAPFQRLEFLVRDWTEFDESMSDEQMVDAMEEYLNEVLAERTANDLAFTREQIRTCFSDISCWLLPHPGFQVTKLSYDGTIDMIEPLFLRGVSGLMHRVFSDLEPKIINGHFLGAKELGNFVKAYVGMFADGARFPQATTMLEATATANNRNAKEKALDIYNNIMDRACGTHREATFLPDEQFRTKISQAEHDAYNLFDKLANMGRKAAILDTRKELSDDFHRAKSHYKLMNDARNPFLNAGIYAAPLAIAALAYIVRKTTDAVCPDEGSFLAQRCNAVEDFLKEVHTFFVFGTIAYSAWKFWGLSTYLKNIVMNAVDIASKQYQK